MSKVPVLVTGGAGYIGSHAVLALKDAGWPVAVIDNLSNGSRSVVPDDVPFFEGSIADRALIDRILAGQRIGAIMHFAGSIVVPESVEKPLDYYANNTLASHALISAAVAGQQPAAVSVPGSLNSELGCAGDWMPDCPQAQLALDPADGIWKLSVPNLPAGNYEFKAAINGSWAENYGLGGAANGSNIALKHDGGPVTFRYDPASHLLSTR